MPHEPRPSGHVHLPADGLITLSRWPDPVVESVGHPVRSEYVERFWLGVLGPTATWLLRRCSDEVLLSGTPVRVDLAVLAASLGLVHHAGRHNPFARGFDRCVMFGLMRHTGDPHGATLAVRTVVPPLAARQVARLPHELQVAHSDYLHSRTGVISVQG
ncbi:MAG: hypothetical protein ACKOQ7_13330 [Actinomycetota bacterium]